MAPRGPLRGPGSKGSEGVVAPSAQIYRLPFGGQFSMEFHFRLAAPYTPAPLRGPLPLKGTQGIAPLPLVSP